MSGEQELSKELLDSKREDNTEEKLKKFISEMNDYITGVGLGNLTYNAEIDKAMSMTEAQLRGMSGEECAMCGYKLQQFSLYIQKEQNRYKNIAKWSQHNMNLVVAKEMGNYSDYASYQTKVDVIKSDNAYARALNRIYLNAISKSEELDFISTRISGMAQSFKDLQYAKRYQN